MLDLMRSEAGARRREWLDAMSEQTWARQQAEEERQKEEAKAMAKLAARLASPPLSPARSRMILNDKRVQSQNFDVHLGSMATFTVAEGACTASATSNAADAAGGGGGRGGGGGGDGAEGGSVVVGAERRGHSEPALEGAPPMGANQPPIAVSRQPAGVNQPPMGDRQPPMAPDERLVRDPALQQLLERGLVTESGEDSQLALQVLLESLPSAPPPRAARPAGRPRRQRRPRAQVATLARSPSGKLRHASCEGGITARLAGEEGRGEEGEGEERPSPPERPREEGGRTRTRTKVGAAQSAGAGHDAWLPVAPAGSSPASSPPRGGAKASRFRRPF